MNYRINILCLIGAIIGIIAIFTAWFVDWNLIDVLNLLGYLGYLDAGLLIAGSLLFVIGTLIAIFSPLGGFLQIIGVSMFLAWYVSEVGIMPSGIGPYLGITSAIIVLISLELPIVIGYDVIPIDKKERVLTFSMSKEISLMPSKPSEQIAAKFCRYCGSKLPSDSEFCENCGKRLASNRSEMVAKKLKIPPPPPEQNP